MYGVAKLITKDCTVLEAKKEIVWKVRQVCKGQKVINAHWQQTQRHVALVYDKK